jgi:hypothetical protein
MSSVNPRTSYRLDAGGTIFTEIAMEVLGPKGEIIGTTASRRTPYEPMQLRQNPMPKNDKDPGGPVQIVETDLSAHPDENLKQLAEFWWTPEVKEAHRARLAAAIARPKAKTR